MWVQAPIAMPGAIPHHKAGVQFLDSPRRREAAGRPQFLLALNKYIAQAPTIVCRGFSDANYAPLSDTAKGS
jgi:hypothetical protein